MSLVFRSFAPSLLEELSYPSFPFRVLVPRQQEMLAQMSPFVNGSARCDLSEKPDSFEISAEVPGFNKDEVDVSVHDGNVIHIKADHAGETKESDEEVSGVKVHRIERSSGSLFRSFKLPPSADLERLAAKAENGVLNIVVPKKTEAAAAGPRRVPVA